jgi:hypothetical protein
VDNRSWSPSVGLTVIGWLAALAAAGWCASLFVGYADPAGRLISGVAAVALAVAALYGTRARPRLQVDPDGLTVGGLLRSRHYPWPLVRDVRVLETRRFGVRGSLLEVDTVTTDGDERLLVFGRLDLAADPEEVAAQLLQLRPPTSGRSPT